jgi:hypothetical protein
MLELNGIRAWIGVDGKELKQYGVQVSSDRKVTCWIASEEGKVCGIILFQDVRRTRTRACSLLLLSAFRCVGGILQVVVH